MSLRHHLLLLLFIILSAALSLSYPFSKSHHILEKTLRYFPISSGKKNCYSIPAGVGRHFLRTFIVYDNFDGKSHSPSFDLSVEGTLVFSWRSPWPESVSRFVAYSDLFFYLNDSAADICFYSIATDSPVVGSLELTQIDPNAYPFDYTSNYILTALTALGDGGRALEYELPVDAKLDYLLWFHFAEITVNGNKAGQRGRAPEYELPVDAKLDYLLWCHFAEIDVNGNKAGQRVFDVFVNGENVSRVDVYKQVGGFASYDWSYVVRNLSTTTLSVRLEAVVGVPIICGLKNYAIVPVDLNTSPDQERVGMEILVPLPHGMLGRELHRSWYSRLEGYISDQIGLLTNLVSLNLSSSNSLGGDLPSGLGQKSLVKLDLSDNKFTGVIPDSLTSSTLQLVLLNDNLLEGQVPEELYSIGVHGGAIDLSGNKGLCGVPSLPDCPLFGALAAKRNRYHRQKSLMTLEMESQHAK
ncbi:unnamed protein product [Fraxinus pennsylvanica]|uniref:Malectin-like domain-containing protein n=1 Tax=Fraxinus pennsylvanica TaxID=56036 RepID=A0AAD1YWL0_9LAMI|nr:unnamed protein product [Fraxinus pennsylvanica]